MYTFQCKYCQKTFQSESKTRKYCSVACRDLAYVGRPSMSPLAEISIKQCQYCHKDFSCKSYNLDRKFCSQECYFDSGRKKTNCGCCGKEIERIASQTGDRNYCSIECRNKIVSGKSIQKGIQNASHFQCAQCGIEFTRNKGKFSPRTKVRLCSKECFQRWAKENKRVGKDNPLFTSVSVQCSFCGSPILRKPYRAKEEIENFCGMTCYGQWRSENIVGSNNPVWRGGDQVGYRGPNWKKQSTAARKRDSYRCQSCGTHEKKLDRLLDVHHIKPFREFGYIPDENDNYLQANELSNLISLCPSCHKSAEWRLIPLQPMLLWQE